jgi:bidirectional [NiFe] hydrogenase diaphorase subunit
MDAYAVSMGAGAGPAPAPIHLNSQESEFRVNDPKETSQSKAGSSHPSGDARFEVLEQEIQRDAHPDLRLTAILELALSLFGELPDGVIAFIALKANIPLMQVLLRAQASRPQQKPEASAVHTVMVCTGTACYVRGAEAVLNRIRREFDVVPNEAAPDGSFVLKTARCLGDCSKAPVMVIDEAAFEFVTPDKAVDLIRRYCGAAGR